MSVFILGFKKTDSAPSIKGLNFSDYLPRPAEKEYYELIGRSELIVFSYEAALDKKIEHYDDGMLFVQGYAPKIRFTKIYDFLNNANPARITDFPESFCAVSIKEKQFSFMASVTGSDQIFYAENESHFFVTNRHNLIGALPITLTLRKNTFWWMAGRTHVGDEGTYWNEIKRSLPSRKFVYKDNFLRIVQPDYMDLFGEIKDHEAVDYLNETVPYFQSIFDGIRKPKRLSLTGGKDSRAILGILAATTDLRSVKINTTGNLFSPDVNSALDLSRLLSISNAHAITRPKISQGVFDYADAIANDMLVDFLGKSLADLSKFSFSGELVLGGHEVGIKSKLNTKKLDEFIVSRRFWCDDQGILSEPVREEQKRRYANRLRNALSGVPVRCYDKIEGLEFRISNRNSTNITSSHIGGSQLHPFYDGKILRAVCGMSSKLISSQFIPYFYASLPEKDIVNVPFADDSWPHELKESIKRGIISGGKEIYFSNPYKFRSYFPSEKGFGLFNWRIELCELSANGLYSYLNDNKAFFDYLDMDKVEEILFKSRDDKKFREIYVHLALLKSALVHYCGELVLDFSKKPEITKKIGDFLSRASDGENNDRDIALEEMVLKYEKSIAEMERYILSLTEEGQKKRESIREELVKYLVTGNAPCNIEDYNDEFIYLESEPVRIFEIHRPGRYVLEGYYFSPDAGVRCSLLLFDDCAQDKIKNISYSATVKSWYKYVNVDPETGRFKVELFVEGGVDFNCINVYIKKWRGESDVYFQLNAK